VNSTLSETQGGNCAPASNNFGEIKIETGVPPPVGFPYKNRRLPFHEMKPGMSFFVPLNKISFQKEVTRVQVATTRWRQSFPESTWVTRVEHDEGGIRVWRLT
jgi:hypothetical protein